MMACQHPFGIERITDENGRVGGRCPACGMTSYLGETFWQVVRRWLFERGRA